MLTFLFSHCLYEDQDIQKVWEKNKHTWNAMSVLSAGPRVKQAGMTSVVCHSYVEEISMEM
jgi:hypothetical protein